MEKMAEQVLCKMKNYYKELSRKGTSYIQEHKGRITSVVTSCV